MNFEVADVGHKKTKL